MTKYTTRVHPVFGHRVLEPMPTQNELEDFYRNSYYQLIDEGKRAADIARSRRGGAEAEEQATWLRETLHADIGHAVKKYSSGKKVLEVGCGLGLLLADMRDQGFEVEGIDLGSIAVDEVRKKGFTAYLGSFEELVKTQVIKPETYDAVLFVNVLEQTFDPVLNLKTAESVLKPGGVAIVRSGNDFNPLQKIFHGEKDSKPYWVSPPEHIHYLSFNAMEKMLEAAALQPVYRQSDFPMELFLLLGYDYTSDSRLGAECHSRRVSLERKLPSELRRDLYSAFAQLELGRCMFVVGQKKAI
ncbi:class I SAM-dependent methyltransferase [Methylobacillus arboreus]|uniref:class I SAM-dependent methyltransferase n=1 Tax=Methylobacillus arboreus TaxID=755170 RepID=UPI001E63848A|nr:class I SAM-dependent methyltransferase [Methylobacillus arboreus]MCB5189974.1 class I SAM-dependent methyltransferase [Methylobacillus arboreus]